MVDCGLLSMLQFQSVVRDQYNPVSVLFPGYCSGISIGLGRLREQSLILAIITSYIIVSR